MNKLYNMSAAPRSVINIDIEEPNSMIVFDIKRLCALKFKCCSNLYKKLYEYVQNNKKVIESVELPSAYIITYNIVNLAENKLNYKYCDDINLCYCVCSKIVNNIYIPNKEIKLKKEIFDRTFCICEDDLYGK